VVTGPNANRQLYRVNSQFGAVGKVTARHVLTARLKCALQMSLSETTRKILALVVPGKLGFGSKCTGMPERSSLLARVVMARGTLLLQQVCE